MSITTSYLACTLKTDSDYVFSLETLKGKRTVLFFYPKDDTPGCTREAIAFSEAKPEFEALGVQVFGVSKDSVASHQAFIQKHKLTVPLLSDENKQSLEAFDVWKEKKNYGKTYMGVVRTTIVLNADGVIEKRWNNVSVDGHVQAVLEYLNGTK